MKMNVLSLKSVALSAALLAAAALTACSVPPTGGTSTTPGAEAWRRDVTILNLSATAKRDVKQDTLTATLRIEAQGDSPQTVQNQINQTMQQALAAAAQVATVTATTQGYHVYQQRDFRPVEPTSTESTPTPQWTGQQTLVLESTTPADVLKLTGALQQMGFATSGLNYSLSEGARIALRDELIAEAISKMQAQADKIATQLGRPKVHFATLNFDDISRPPVMYARMEKMAMAADGAMAEPVAKEGETSVSTTVNAEVYLSK